MNCGKYQNLISSLLDGELDEKTSVEVRSHLLICEGCSRLHEDFSSILSFSEETFAEDSIPPNSQALWCRINNIIETEIEADLVSKETASTGEKQSYLRTIFGGPWQFSPSQIFSSVIGVALISSLLTIVAVKNFSGPNEIHTDAELQPNFFETVLSKVGFAETPQQKYQRRIDEQKSAIAYWKKRVEIRKVQWDSHLQEAFDRNLEQINKVVNEYTKILQENPQDKISTEMLDSALSEKMDFLREFAEL